MQPGLRKAIRQRLKLFFRTQKLVSESKSYREYSILQILADTCGLSQVCLRVATTLLQVSFETMLSLVKSTNIYEKLIFLV